MSNGYFFPSPDGTALFAIAEQPTVPTKFILDSDPGGLIYNTFEEAVDHVANYPAKDRCVINCCISDNNLERERRWKLLESKGIEKVIHYGQNAITMSVMLKNLQVKAAVGETVIYCVNYNVYFLTKHATGWRVDVLSETDDPRLFFKLFNIKRVMLDSRQGKEVNEKVKEIFVGYKISEVTLNLPADATWKCYKSIFNDDNFDGCLVDNYDVVGLFAEFKGTSFCIHNGVTMFPFEKSVELDIGDASQLKINGVRHEETFLIKHFTMKTKKLRRIRLTVKQHNLWHFEASLTVLDRQEVLENGLAALNISQNTITQKEATKASKGYAENESKKSAEANPTDTKSVKATVTFTTNNRILIEAGPKYSGDAEIPCYFRMQQTGDTKRIQIGAEAQKHLKDNPKTVIYDIPGIMAAASNPACEQSSWKFETSRAPDGGLLIHLGNDNKTIPLALFTSIIQHTYAYIKDNLECDIESIVIRLPGEITVSKSDLARASDKVGVPLYTS